MTMTLQRIVPRPIVYPFSTHARKVPPTLSLSSRPSSPIEATTSFDHVQKGMGRLVASSSSAKKATNLVVMSHQAPCRWIPLTNSAIRKAGAAICYFSNYGGGLLGADRLEYDIHVKADATLGLLTQGSNRVYRQKRVNINNTNTKNNLSRQRLRCVLDKDSLMVLAPDPVTCYEASAYEQEQSFSVHPSSSLVAIDWFGAGRLSRGERWLQDSISNRTILSFHSNEDQTSTQIANSNEVPFLMDCQSLNRTLNDDISDNWGMNWSSCEYNTYASMILYGPKVTEVIQRCQALQPQFMMPFTGVRQRRTELQDEQQITALGEEHDRVLTSLSSNGRILMGISEISVPTPNSSSLLQTQRKNKVGKNKLYLARFAATSNEDLYRVFHYCLQPLAPSHFGGMEFYKDRIRAVKSTTTITPPESSRVPPSLNEGKNESLSVPSLPPPMHHHGNNADATASAFADSSSYWTAFILADSALPVGSFAHSAGLEAAQQLQLLKNEEDVSTFVQAATRSCMQICSPFVVQSHQLVTTTLCNDSDGDDDTLARNERFMEQWLALDGYKQALMASNQPACRASLDQGRSLARVASKLLRERSHHQNRYHDKNYDAKKAIISLLQNAVSMDPHKGHLSCVFGSVTASAGLESALTTCHLLGFCVARDIVSAAVRLNLIGPLASVSHLAAAKAAAELGVQTALSLHEEKLKTQEYSEKGNTNGSSTRTMAAATAAAAAAGCSPVLDAIQPCHDLLDVRLFRT